MDNPATEPPGAPRRKPGPPPSAELAVQRKKEIVRAAALIFFQKGYAATGMDDIAAALGSTKGLIYHYFKSKSEIIFSLFCSVQDEARVRFEQLIESSETPREALHCIIEYCSLRVLEAEWKYAFVMASELNQALSETELRIVQERARNSTDVVQRVIEAGIAQGQFINGHPRVLARICLNTVLQTAQWFQPEGSITQSELTHTVSQFVLQGITRQPVPAGESPPTEVGTASVPGQGPRLDGSHRPTPVADVTLVTDVTDTAEQEQMNRT